MDYYLYSHSNADGIFYIGKGCNNRKDDFYKSRSVEWRSIAKNSYLTKVEAMGTESDILSLERIVIKSLVEQGIKLVNKIHNPNWKPSDETVQKRKVSCFGYKHSDLTKKKLSDAGFLRRHSDKTKKKISEATDNKGKNNPFFGKTTSDSAKKKLSFCAKKQWQHFKLAKANNYRGSL